MKFRLCLALCGSLACTSAFGTQLFVNGGFENGDLSSWNSGGTAGSGDAFSADNTGVSPEGFPTVGPNSGSWYAVSDSTGCCAPGTEQAYLTQNVTIPLFSTDDLLSFAIFVNDDFGSSGAGGEVGIWAAGADPLLTGPLFLLYGPVDTAVSGGNPNPYVDESLDIASDVVAGLTYQIGVLESDTTGPINVGVDDFSLVTSTPEPGMLFPVALLGAGMLFYRARRKVRAEI
jgi:hypothetical protein